MYWSEPKRQKKTRKKTQKKTQSKEQQRDVCDTCGDPFSPCPRPNGVARSMAGGVAYPPRRRRGCRGAAPSWEAPSPPASPRGWRTNASLQPVASRQPLRAPPPQHRRRRRWTMRRRRVKRWSIASRRASLTSPTAPLPTSTHSTSGHSRRRSRATGCCRRDSSRASTSYGRRSCIRGWWRTGESFLSIAGVNPTGIARGSRELPIQTKSHTRQICHMSLTQICHMSLTHFSHLTTLLGSFFSVFLGDADTRMETTLCLPAIRLRVVFGA